MGRRRHGSGLPSALRVGLGWPPRALGGNFLAPIAGSCPGVEFAFLTTAVGRVSRWLAFFGRSRAIAVPALIDGNNDAGASIREKT